MMQYIAARPVELKGKRYRIGETVPRDTVTGGRAGWLVRMGYLVQVDDDSSSTESTSFGISLIPSETDVDGLGKTAAELGDLSFSEDGGFSGTLHYVTGYTGFYGSDPQQQEGYFLPFSFALPDGWDKAHMMVKGGSGVSVQPTVQNVIFLGNTVEDAEAKRLVITLNQVDPENPDNINSAVREYPLSGLTFEKAKQQKKASGKG